MFPKVAPKFFKERNKGPVVFTAPEKKAGGAVGSVSSGSYTVTVNGTDYAVSSSNGTFTVNGTAYSVNIKENTVSASAQKAPAAAQPATVSKPAAQQPALQGQTSAGAGGEKLTAPVAGTLLRYSVAEGAQVSEGQTVMMLESMKMELEINAHKAGLIHFAAAAGAQVAEGDLLAEIR